MDEDRKVVDLTPMEYEVKEGKRKEPFLNWWAVPGFILAIVIMVLFRLAVGDVTAAVKAWLH